MIRDDDRQSDSSIPRNTFTFRTHPTVLRPCNTLRASGQKIDHRSTTPLDSGPHASNGSLEAAVRTKANGSLPQPPGHRTPDKRVRLSEKQARATVKTATSSPCRRPDTHQRAFSRANILVSLIACRKTTPPTGIFTPPYVRRPTVLRPDQPPYPPTKASTARKQKRAAEEARPPRSVTPPLRAPKNVIPLFPNIRRLAPRSKNHVTAAAQPTSRHALPSCVSRNRQLPLNTSDAGRPSANKGR